MIAVSACGNSDSNSAGGGPRFAYVANSTSGNVSAFAINAATGALKRIDCGGGTDCNGMDFAAGTGAIAIATIGR